LSSFNSLPSSSTHLSQLTVTDFISDLKCHITLNNNWSVFFSHILSLYTSIHCVIQIATQAILHWGVKCGFSTPPPATSNPFFSPDSGLSSIPSNEHSKGSLIHNEGALPFTHINLSVILILWIRYLIDTYPQITPVTDLIVDHLDTPAVQVTETVEVEMVLLKFFEFYRNVDFSTSVISIRSGSSTLKYRRSGCQTSKSHSTTLFILDPIVDRSVLEPI